MTKITREYLAEWEKHDDRLEDDLYGYFESVSANLHDYLDAAKEGRELMSCMFKDMLGDTQIDKDSPLDYLLTSIAYAAHDCALNAVATALGLNKVALFYVLDDLISEGSPFIGFDALKERIAEIEKDIKHCNPAPE